MRRSLVTEDAVKTYSEWDTRPCSVLPLGEDFVRVFLRAYTNRPLSVKKHYAYSFPSMRFIYRNSITHSAYFVKGQFVLAVYTKNSQ